jgi:RNA polymerase sigma-70 factor (ECF subfamily)
MGTEPAACSDEELVRAVADGDASALRVLYERHAPWLLVRLTRRCADAGLVEEVLQDTFVGVWRNARRYRGTGEVAGWGSPSGG